MKKLLLPAVLVFIASTFLSHSGNFWTINPVNLPYPLAVNPAVGFTSISDTNKYLIFPGGLANDSISKKVLRMNVNSNSFDTLPPLPERLMNGAAFKSGDSIYYAGGYKPGWNETKIGMGDSINKITFPSIDTGFIVGVSNKIYRTTNKGLDWFTFTLSGVSKKIININFVNSKTGWISVSGDTSKIYRTTNSGLNWTNTYSTDFNKNFSGLYFLNSLTGFAVGSSGSIIKSIDSGKTWTSSVVDTVNYKSVKFDPMNSNGYACGTSGKIIKTTNSGSTWINISPAGITNLNSICPVSSSKIFCVGNSGTIYYSSNAGTNWVLQSSGVTYNLNDIHFLDSNRLAIVGDNGTYLYTTTGGSKWERRRGITPDNLVSISQPIRDTVNSIISSKGFVYKDNNIKFDYTISNKTYKLGIIPLQASWSERDTLPKPLAEIFNSSATTQSKFGFIAGGVTNNNIFSSSVYFYNAIAMKWFSSNPLLDSSSIGCLVAVNDSALVYSGGKERDSAKNKTYKGAISYNAGGISSINWTEGAVYPGGATFGHNGVGFKNIGYALFAGGNNIVHFDNPFSKAFVYNYNDDYYFEITDLSKPICHTGVDNISISGSPENYKGIFPVKVYAAGGMTNSNYRLTDTIQVYQNDDITNIVNELVINNFYLYQNYPNPFNPVTKIKFNLNKKEFIKLSVYDVTGKEISILKQGYESPGSFEYEFNGKNLSSGIYFYSLQTESAVLTKKMMLIK